MRNEYAPIQNGFLAGEDVLHNAGIRCRIDAASDWPDVIVPSEVRHSVFLTVKEALHNILRHAAAGEVRCRLTHEAGQIELILEDNGRGFVSEAPPVRPGRGHGLQNLRNRMERLGGTFTIQSKPGAGTRVCLRVPLGPARMGPNGIDTGTRQPDCSSVWS